MVESSLKELLLICQSFPIQISNLGDDVLCAKTEDGRWSKKEILGHLCDSAFVNITRLTRGQAEDAPQLFYDQDKWVKLQDYQSYQVGDLINLWHSLNLHFHHIANSLDKPALERICIDKDGNQSSLAFLITDYVVHLKHHLKQVTGKS